MYRITATFNLLSWFVASGTRPNHYILTDSADAAIMHVDMNDAIRTCFLARHDISQDIDLLLEHSIETSEGEVWVKTNHIISPDFLDGLLAI